MTRARMGRFNLWTVLVAGSVQRAREGRSRWTRLGAIATLAIMVAGCEGGTGSSGGLKIGTLLPITGDLAQYGQPMEDSARLLVETVNACEGALGQPVTLITADDETDPARGTTAMAKLTEVDRVAAVIGAASSAVSSATVDIAVRNRVLQISPASTSPVFTERAQKGDFQGYWFRTAPPDTFQGEAIAQFAKKRNYRRVSVLAINNDYGNGLVESFISSFQAIDGQLQGQPTRYLPDTASFTSEVGAAFQGAPDAVLLIAYPETGSLILKTAYQQGLLEGKTQVIATDGMKDNNIAELVGAGSDGKLIAAGLSGTAPSAGGPALQAFRDRYQQKYNRQPSVYDPNTWDAGALIVLAAEAAKSTEGSVIKDKVAEVANAPGQEVLDVCEALQLVREGRDINYQGASGFVDFDAQGDVTGTYDVWSVTDQGELQVTDQVVVGGES